MNSSQDPFASRYGSTPPQMPSQYGGMPIQAPRKSRGGFLIPLILTVFLLFGSVIFGVWAYAGMEDYKKNSDAKSAKAVAIAEQKLSTEKDKEFLEREKSPLRTYQGPQAFGSVKLSYPKTWSAYVTEEDSGSSPVDGYFHPNYVPGLKSETDFALRLRVLSKQYTDELKQYESKAKSGKVTISPYRAPKMPATIVGSRVAGEVIAGQQDIVVLFPLRDKTIEISTQSAQFAGDFDSIIMANFTFSP